MLSVELPRKTESRRRSLSFFQVKEVSQRKGEVTVTRLINVTTPPFHSEVPGLQALTWYNMSVSCSNEVGSSPITTWVQSSTSEGGVWALRKRRYGQAFRCMVCRETASGLFSGSIVLLIVSQSAHFICRKPIKTILVIHNRPPLCYGPATDYKRIRFRRISAVLLAYRFPFQAVLNVSRLTVCM